MGSRRRDSKSAKARGMLKKHRRKRAERRDATREVREAINDKMRVQRHPGWDESRGAFAWLW